MSELLSTLLLLGLTLRLMRLVMVDEAGGMLRWPLVLLGSKLAGIRGIDFVERFLSCPFCVGFWISVATSWSWLAFGDTLVWYAVALPFTVSWVAGHLAARLDLDAEE